MNEGWIKLHRRLKDHWIWSCEKRLKWWLDILLTVNHADASVFIRGQLIECKRGQSIRSLSSWAMDWGISKKAVRDFFKLLESDKMLVMENLSFTTRITVCKYDDYQDQVNAKETVRKRRGNAKETLGLPKQECKEDIDKSISYTTISDFYLKQVKVAEKYLEKKSEDPRVKNDVEAYKNFVLFLYDWDNKNCKDPLGDSTHAPLVNVLGIKKQLKFTDFVKHYTNAKKLGIDFYEKIRAMENRPGILKNRADLNLTLIEWIKPYKND